MELEGTSVFARLGIPCLFPYIDVIFQLQWLSICFTSNLTAKSSSNYFNI